MKDLFFSKLKFSTWFGILVTAVWIFSTIMEGGKNGLLALQIFSVISISLMFMTSYTLRKEREDSEGFLKTNPDDLRDLREAMLEGLMGICLSATVIYYGHISEKIVSIILSVVIVRMMAGLYKSYKEYARHV